MAQGGAGLSNIDGTESQHFSVSILLFLTRARCWVHYNHNYSSLFPWARLPWVNKFSTWTNTPDRPHPWVLLALLESGDIVMMTMQTTQIGLTRSLSVYWETRGLEQEIYINKENSTDSSLTECSSVWKTCPGRKVNIKFWRDSLSHSFTGNWQRPNTGLSLSPPLGSRPSVTSWHHQSLYRDRSFKRAWHLVLREGDPTSKICVPT